MAYIKTAKDTLVQSLLASPDVARLIDGVERALVISFREMNMRNPTLAEQKRRFDICMDWALTLRGDLKWPIQRICDSMPEILRTELSGARWQPSDRKVWIPADGLR